ncbi:MAG TPA: hypothetical protein VGV38_12900 [Pyrinomonadaceae bacterium]|nr:hypothetical protein [Pyrinomonadaceae bacterium]
MSTTHVGQGSETLGSGPTDFGSAPGESEELNYGSQVDPDGSAARGSMIDPNGGSRSRGSQIDPNGNAVRRARGRRGRESFGVPGLLNVGGRGAGVGSTVCWLLTGVTLGAGLMYLFDPERGRRRRALLRDKCVSLSNQTGDTLGRTARHLSNRAQGVAAEASRALGKRWPHQREQNEDMQFLALQEATQMDNRKA